MSLISGSIASFHALDDHIHSPQRAMPSNSGPITIYKASGAWQFGSAYPVIVSGQILKPYDVHWVEITDVSENGDYCMELWAGAVSSATVVFSRSNPFTASHSKPCQTIIQRAKYGMDVRLAGSPTNSGSNVGIKFLFHEYE